MNVSNWIQILFSSISGVAVGATITGWVSLTIHKRVSLLDYITRERALWRERLRELTVEVIEAAQNSDVPRLRRLRASFALRLNPLVTEQDDREIRHTLFGIENAVSYPGLLVLNLEKLVSAKLKEDWERSKAEAKATRYPFRIMYDANQRTDPF